MCIASVKAPLVEWYDSSNSVSCRVELPSALVVMVCCIFLAGLQSKIRYNCSDLLYLQVIGAVRLCGTAETEI